MMRLPCIPLAGDTMAANVPEIKELLPLVDSAGPLDDVSGEPRHRPEKLYGDRAYDSEPHREKLRERGIDPKLPNGTRSMVVVWGNTVGWWSDCSPGCTGSANCGL